MVSTVKLVLFSVTFLIAAAAVWWWVVARQYSSHIAQESYTRGANLSVPAPASGASATAVAGLSCEGENVICVYKATSLCTSPDLSTGQETSVFDPISATNYGCFDTNTTVDLTGDMSGACNGKSTCNYTFTGMNGCKSKTGNPAYNQLVSTYMCIPPGQKCQAYAAV